MPLLLALAEVRQGKTASFGENRNFLGLGTLREKYIGARYIILRRALMEAWAAFLLSVYDRLYGDVGHKLKGP